MTWITPLSAMMSTAVTVALSTLRRETPQTISSLAQQLGARRIEQELRALGCCLVRAPMEIEQPGSLCGAPPAGFQSGKPFALPQVALAPTRRFDNKALAQISTTSVKLKCECPHQLSELLVRLGNFETYSAECENSSPADADLHHYLKETAGNARAMLEVALGRIAEAEGLPLPE